VFFSLHEGQPGKILRSQAVTQEFSWSLTEGNFSSKPESELSQPWSLNFSLLDHILGNQSPFMTLAFPRILHDYYRMAFDESLSTTEDWDFLLRTAGIVGVANSTTVTAVYKRWHGLTSSADLPATEWGRNSKVILEKLNSSPILLPPGEVSSLYELVVKETQKAQNVIRIQLDKEFREEAKAVKDAISRYYRVKSHTYWRIVGPLRWLIDLVRGRLGLWSEGPDFGSLESVTNATTLITSSIWWRIYRKLPQIFGSAEV
jgi:hypothetical protein